MIYYTIKPPPSLAQAVRFFWVFEGAVDPGVPYVYRSMADACSELLFHYRGTFEELTGNTRTPSFCSGVHAQSQSYRRFVIDDSFGIFGVYLYPFATRWLFGMPSDELTGRMPDLHTMLGSAGRELEERMMLAPDNEHRYRVLSAFLERQLANAGPG